MRKQVGFVLRCWAIAFAMAIPHLLWSQVVMKNPVKEMLNVGKPAIGVSVTVGHPEVAAALAIAGFDFFWLETEHSPLGLESVREMILSTRGLKTVPITRVPHNELWLVKRALDVGSLGVIFPFTSTRELAEKAVKACKEGSAIFSGVTGVRGVVRRYSGELNQRCHKGGHFILAAMQVETHSDKVALTRFVTPVRFRGAVRVLLPSTTLRY